MRWWDGQRLPEAEAQAFAKRLEATGRYRCVVFPLTEGEALLHADDRDGPGAGRFRFRTAAECAALLAGPEDEQPAPRQLTLWDAA